MINIGVIALLFSMIEIICKNIGTGNPTNNIINKWLIVNFMGYFIISGIIIFWLYHIFENLRFQFGNRELFKEDRYKWLKNEKFITVMNIIVIFVAWIPFFLRFYPGIVTSDSYSQIEQTIGLIGLSDHHPITHTAIIGIFINIGLKLTNNINVGIALYSIFFYDSNGYNGCFSFKISKKKESSFNDSPYGTIVLRSIPDQCNIFNNNVERCIVFRHDVNIYNPEHRACN